MSIGELTSMYQAGELIVRPEFQRFFRWDDLQKSRLIESLLLGIPLPSIFVSTTESGAWEIVDGLQRVSTLLQLQGVLKLENGTMADPLRLVGTKYLPDLEGRVWPMDKNSVTDDSLPATQVLDIRRSRIDIQIIKRESSPDAKYDLFQRLNSYGSMLTPQELRSAMLVAVDPEFLKWVENLAKNSDFVDCVQISERNAQEQYDIELVIRFLVLHGRDPLRQNDLRNFAQFLNDESLALALSPKEDLEVLKRTFETTFKVINENAGEDAFRRWIPAKSAYSGSFLNTSYEVVAIGLGYHVAKNRHYRTDIEVAVKSFWSRPEMNRKFATGISTEKRLTQFIDIGRKLLALEPAQPTKRLRRKKA
ncbi:MULTISPECIES: GmrSD restriction endonuclease domain-containing protein [unclassified Rhodococcus (in: high G+C Gram-positive bacteria)]|uniref:GmrSD restriction endonuclease domain-containing protein n=1 Tax=unclassified Rhodococcus (in: high G+C Gram-positive bacteria) TaxID=192944 RepID=UPI0020CBFEE0|nr:MULTISPECIES: DUF262 domain-containing protein [unclassified Rhodococcus (in: high G+C Gram-positive bacteria)]